MEKKIKIEMRINMTIKNSYLWIYIFLIFFCTSTFAQTPTFTRQDTLRGSITDERKWWDLTYYHLDVIVDPSDSTL